MAFAGDDHLQRTPADVHRLRRRRLAHIAVAVVLLTGIGASAMAGQAWAAKVQADNDAAVDEKAQDVGNNVATLLARQGDITEGALTFIQVSPDAGPARFQRWFEAVAESGRHPGLQLFGAVEVVQASDPARLASVLDEMSGRFGEVPPDLMAQLSTYDLTLDPTRSQYCLMTAIAGDIDYFRNNLQTIEPAYRKLDVCNSPIARYLELATDSGAVVAGRWGSPNVIGFVAPRYAGDTVPVTLEERRATLIAAMGGIVDARALLQSATSDHGLWLGLERLQPDGAREQLATSADSRPSGGATRTVSIEADGAWQLTVSGVQTANGMSSSTQGLALALGGGVVTLLLAALAEVLVRGRDRALRLVDERTGELRHLALHDPLTGLANRTLIADRAQQMLQRARRHGQNCAALFIDLDEFKDINDSIGHDAGDLLLKLVARRFQGVLRDGDTVGRMGGDEFVILLDGDDSLVDPEQVAARILAVMREPFWLIEGGAPYTVTASVGVAVGRYEDASDLLRDADVAVYNAKAAGRDRHVLFMPEMQTAVENRLAMANELRGALGSNELYLEYQPTFDIDDGRINGFEALVRWDHPSRGVVPPMDFIPFSEDTGLIVDVGGWVLHEACTQMAAWHLAGHHLRINVNVSSRQLERADFATTVADILRETGLDPTTLVIEITESALMEDADAMATRLHQLKALGVQLAIDDFGTGYSSLAYLRQFPVDSIKIDRSFLCDLEQSPGAVALLHSLIQLGKNLGLETLAEGIEEEAQLAFLRAEQCDSGQGFLLAHPLPAGAAGRYLVASAGPRAPAAAGDSVSIDGPPADLTRAH